MTENIPTSGVSDSSEQRDRMLRRLTLTFVLAAVATFWMAVGMSAWNQDSVRVELAQQQQMSSSVTSH